MTGCTCHGPGYCDRHGMRKTEGWYLLCKTREDYFKLWEDGRGPGQKKDKQVTSSRSKVDNGPGTELKKLFRSWGVSACGGCITTAKKMDENGPAWCREHIDELVAEVHENATRRGWTTILSKAATILGIEDPIVRWAILESCVRAEYETAKELNNGDPS